MGSFEQQLYSLSRQYKKTRTNQHQIVDAMDQETWWSKRSNSKDMYHIYYRTINLYPPQQKV